MNEVSIEDFQKLDIRIGTVIKAEVPEWSHWVVKLTVDFASGAKSAKEVRSGGEDGLGKRIIFAGLLKFYKPEDLIGKQFPFVLNMKPKKIGPEGDESCGMLLAVDLEEKGEEKCILFGLKEEVPNGTKVH